MRKIVTLIKNTFFKRIVPILFIISMVINIISFESIHILHGDSRTVNFAGVIRGASQRLIKQELSYNPNDELIEEIDSIIHELGGNNGENNLAVMDYPKFQQALLKVELAWEELKDQIYVYRAGEDSQQLYELSEVYFTLTNDLVFAAQEYSEQKMDRITALRPRLILSISLILAIYVYQLVSTIFLRKDTKRLSNIAYIDSLTKLPNRAYFSEVVIKYQRMAALPLLACIFFDMNNLKITNDTYGHEYGDKLLQGFSKILKETSKDYGFVCRNGGDEFIAIFENPTKEDIDNFLNSLRDKVNKYNENNISISFATGIAFSNEPNVNNINELLTLADKRMYEDKEKTKKSSTSIKS